MILEKVKESVKNHETHDAKNLRTRNPHHLWLGRRSIQRGAVNMLFYGAVIAFCSQYRQAVNSRHSLEAVLDTLDSCSQSYQN